MYRPRVIPVLLLKNRGLVKTIRFKDSTYLGDPVNVVRIFNDKEVDELLFLDITATNEGRRPPFDLIAKVAEECFMPLGYGGGVRDVGDVRTILSLGVEKVSINTSSVEDPNFISTVADAAGSQSVVVSIDVKRDWTGKYRICTRSGTRETGLDLVQFAKEVERRGAGEILLNSMDQDGLMQGYDLNLIRLVSQAVNIPVVACGGAGKVKDLADAVLVGGASAAAAGSLFVFHGRHRAVLINYPDSHELQEAFQSHQ